MSIHGLSYASHSLDDTALIARCLAQHLRKPVVLALIGDLGAGKSAFARAFVSAYGYGGDVPSPTFTIVQTYDDIGPNSAGIWHVDAYRLETPQEALHLGLEDAIEDVTCLIEWPEKLGDILPDDRIDITLARVAGRDDTARMVTLETQGAVQCDLAAVARAIDAVPTGPKATGA